MQASTRNSEAFRVLELERKLVITESPHSLSKESETQRVRGMCLKSHHWTETKGLVVTTNLYQEGRKESFCIECILQTNGLVFVLGISLIAQRITDHLQKKLHLPY